MDSTLETCRSTAPCDIRVIFGLYELQVKETTVLAKLPIDSIIILNEISK
jgi:hypothetical protein